MAEQFFVNSATPSGSGRFYTELDTNQGKFWYVPQEFVQKGLRQGDVQFLERSFLNRDYLNTFKPIKLDDPLVTEQLKNAGYQDPSVGVLISDADYNKYDKDAGYVTTYNAVDKFAGPIQGIGNKDGNLVYNFAGAGGSAYGYVNDEGTPTEVTRGKPKFGIIGEIATSVTGLIGQVPFLPEIVGFATGNPYLYGSLKAAQTAGRGGDLEDVLKSGATATASALAMQNITSGPATGAEAGGVAPGTGVEVFPVAPPAELVVTPIAGTPVFVSPDYSLTGGFPSTDPGMGGGTGITSGAPGQGLQAPTVPSAPGMGGGTGLTVPVEGGTVGAGGFTPGGAVPILGDPRSFINDPNVLGTPVMGGGAASGISVMDALRGARLVNSLLNPPQQPTQQQPIGDAQGMGATGIDYNSLLGLLNQRAAASGLLGTRFQPQSINLASLLG